MKIYIKKMVTAIGIFILTTTCLNAAEKCGEPPFNHPHQMPPKNEMIQREKAFEQRLGLTEEQIKQSKLLREEGFEKIKPVIDTLNARKREIDMVKNSNLDNQQKEEKLLLLESEVASLRKQAHEIRKENMKSFEAILTPEQKKIFKEMKQEGRKNFHAKHPINIKK